MKLISMVDYILQIDEIEPKAVNFSSITDIRNYQLNSYSKIVKYAEFLKQELKLEYFIACDENGNVLEEPNPDKFTMDNVQSFDIFREQLSYYKKAKERVLFEGCSCYNPMKSESYYIVEYNNIKIWITNTNRIIEDVILDNLTLTPNTIKQIFKDGK